MNKIKVVLKVELTGPIDFYGWKMTKEEASREALMIINDAFEGLTDGATLDVIIESVEEIKDVRN